MKRLLIAICLSLLILTPAVAGPPMPIFHWDSANNNLLPDADDTYDIGSSLLALEWKNLYIDGTAYLDAIAADVIISGATPNIALEDTTSSKTADAFINNTANDNDDALLSLGVDDSGGDDQTYLELDGITETIDLFENIVISDSKIITFDEAAADPNDCDIFLGGADGVLTIGGLNGVNNEDFSLDFDGTANSVIATSSTGLTTFAFQFATPTIYLNDSTTNKTADAFMINTANDDDDAVFVLGVDDSSGDDTAYFEMDGVNETVEIKKPLEFLFHTVEKSADAVSLSVQECSGTLITNRGWDGNDDQTFTLPEADDASSAGCKFKLLAVVASGGTADTYFDTEGSTTNIYLDGTAIGNGERVWTEEIAIGESIVCHAATIDGTTYDWFCDSINGIWADKGS